MNNDVLKSLGHLKKSLTMTNRAISNAVNADPNDNVDDGLQDLINDLMDTIDTIRNNAVSPTSRIPVAIVPPPTMPPIPSPTDNSIGMIDFLDP